MLNKYLAIFILLLLSNCSNNNSTNWFSETKIEENIFQIGDNRLIRDKDGKKRAIDFILFRSAGIALENHANYFAIIDKDSVNNSPSAAYDNNYIEFNGKFYQTVEPAIKNTIILLHNKPQTSINIYDAAQVERSITSKY